MVLPKRPIPDDAWGKLPPMVRTALDKMEREDQWNFWQEYSRRQKSSASAFFFWLLLGFHYAYLRKWGVQLLYWITIAGFGLWGIADLFRLGGLTDDYNRELAISLLQAQKTISAP